MKTNILALPRVLNFTEAKYYVFSAVFTALAVGAPWIAHQFHIAGQVFLPMHIFVLASGLLFGWRAGLLVGTLSPILSFSLTQMPVMALLPQVTLELAVYGLAIGLLREKNLNIWVSLAGAMILGRLVRIVVIMALFPKMDPIQFIQISLPGIILQLALIPFIVYLIQKFVLDKNAKAE